MSGINSNTKLMLQGNGNNGAQEIRDFGNIGHIVTQVATAQLNSTIKQLGNASLELDGNSDYINLGNVSDFNFLHQVSITPKWTIDFWTRLDDLSATQIFSGNNEGSSNKIGHALWFTGTTRDINFQISNGAGGMVINTSFNGAYPNDNNWHHIELTYDHVQGTNNATLFIDGVLHSQASKTATAPSISNASNTLDIGALLSAGSRILYVNGNMDEIRYSDIVRHTSNFTPSTEEYVSDANTKLLLHMNTQDVSGDGGSGSYHIPKFIGTVQIDTSTKVFGSGSYLFDGNSDYVTLIDSLDWDIYANNLDTHTIDFRIKFSGVTTISQIPIGQSIDGSNEWFILNNASGIRFFMFSGGSLVVDTGFGTGISDNNWHHVSLIIKGNGTTKDIGIYIDGTQVVYKQDNSTASLNAPLTLGAIRNSNFFGGNLDAVRIQKSNYFNASPNIALTDTITIPTQEYDAFIPPQPPTSLVATTFDKNRVDLTWVAPIDTGGSAITGYKIERESPIGGGWSTLIANTGNTNVTYQDIGLSAGTQYNYRLSAISSGGIGNLSNENADITTNGEPDEPLLDSVISNGIEKINLSWTTPINDGGSAITGYKIERESPIGGGWSTLIANTGNTNVTYQDIGLTFNTEHNYRISAINSLGTSSPSNELDTTTNDLIEANTTMLLHFTGADDQTTTIDSSNNNIPLTISGVGKLATEQFKFDESSYELTKAQVSEISFPDNDLMPIGSSDFTIECNFRFTTIDSVAGLMIYRQNDVEFSDELSLKYNSGNSRFDYIEGHPNLPLFFNVGVLTAEIWHHVAIVKSGNLRLFFLNGTLISSQTAPDGNSLNLTSNPIIGDNFFTLRGGGWIDEYRISNVARYTSNFTPKIKAFGTLDAVQTLSTTIINDTIRLNWLEPLETGQSITGYKIERESPIGGGWSTLIANTGNTNLNYVDSSVLDGIEYNYRVSAINLHGAGTPSNESNKIYIPLIDEGILFNKFLKRHQNIKNIKGKIYIDKFTGKTFRRIRRE